MLIHDQKQPFFGFEDLSSSKFDESRVPNVVIAKHLNYATDSVQVQALQVRLGAFSNKYRADLCS